MKLVLFDDALEHGCEGMVYMVFQYHACFTQSTLTYICIIGAASAVHVTVITNLLELLFVTYDCTTIIIRGQLLIANFEVIDPYHLKGEKPHIVRKRAF